MIVSRRAIACWARYREAEPTARAEIVAWAGLSVADIYVLEQLTANLAQCEPERVWFQAQGPKEDYLRDTLAPALLHHLTLRPEDAHRLATALCLATPWRTALVEQALTAHTRGEARIAEKEARAAAPPSPGVPPPPAEPHRSAYARVLEALAAHAVNIAQPLPPEVRREIAGRAGTSEDNVINCVSRARRESGCLIRTRGGTP